MDHIRGLKLTHRRGPENIGLLDPEVAIQHVHAVLVKLDTWTKAKKMFLAPYFALQPLSFQQCSAGGCVIFRDELANETICPRCGCRDRKTILYMPICFLLQIMLGSSKMASILRTKFNEVDTLVRHSTSMADHDSSNGPSSGDHEREEVQSWTDGALFHEMYAPSHMDLASRLKEKVSASIHFKSMLPFSTNAHYDLIQSNRGRRLYWTEIEIRKMST
jgi:hypothetical protein